MSDCGQLAPRVEESARSASGPHSAIEPEVAELLLPVPKSRADVFGVHPQGRNHQRDGNQAEERQLPVQGEQDRRHRDKRHRIDHHVRQGMRDKLLEQVGVIDHVGHQLPHLLVFIKAQG